MVNVLRMEARRKRPNERPGIAWLRHSALPDEMSSAMRKGEIGVEGGARRRAHEALPHASPGDKPPETPVPVSARAARAKRAHEALPHTPPGGKPPETPGPLSLSFDFRERNSSVKGAQAAPKGRALDTAVPFRRFNCDQGKGA